MVEISVKIDAKEKSYPILIENEPISKLAEKIKTFIGNNDFIIVISEKIEKLYGKILNFPKGKKLFLKTEKKKKI